MSTVAFPSELEVKIALPPEGISFADLVRAVPYPRDRRRDYFAMLKSITRMVPGKGLLSPKEPSAPNAMATTTSPHCTIRGGGDTSPTLHDYRALIYGTMEKDIQQTMTRLLPHGITVSDEDMFVIRCAPITLEKLLRYFVLKDTSSTTANDTTDYFSYKPPEAPSYRLARAQFENERRQTRNLRWTPTVAGYQRVGLPRALPTVEHLQMVIPSTGLMFPWLFRLLPEAGRVQTQDWDTRLRFVIRMEQAAIWDPQRNMLWAREGLTPWDLMWMRAAEIESNPIHSISIHEARMVRPPRRAEVEEMTPPSAG